MFKEFSNIEEGIRKAQESVRYTDWCDCQTVRVPLSTLRSSLWYRDNYYIQKEQANKFDSLYQEAQATAEERLQTIEGKNKELAKAQTTQATLGYATAIGFSLAAIGWTAFFIAK